MASAAPNHHAHVDDHDDESILDDDLIDADDGGFGYYMSLTLVLGG